MDPLASTPSSYVGRTFGEFVVREPLGSGGFGLVFRAEQPALAREAVIKVLHQRLLGSRNAVQRFLREAQLASLLDHPYAAHTYAFGAEPDGVLWIAMELVRGVPLDRLLAAQGPIPLERFVPLFERICEVVHTAHEQGIVHRDLKPANVMVLSRAGRLLPKLLDFGIAKLAAAHPMTTLDEPADHSHLAAASETTEDPLDRGRVELAETQQPDAATLPTDRPTRPSLSGRLSGSAAAEITQADAALGSPLYMAPEQWVDAGAVGPRTDLYALGVLAFEALTGRRPFAGTSTPAIAAAHARTPPPPLGPGFPAALDAVVHRALAKRPDDRFATALELAAELRVAAGLSAERDKLPALDDALRLRVLAHAPQPLAQAVAALDAAGNAHQARECLLQIGEVVARLVGLVALAAHAHVGADRPALAADEAIRGLRSGALGAPAWIALARELVRPFAELRHAHPVPELVDLLLGVGAELLDELVAPQTTRRGGRGEARDDVEALLPRAAELLDAVEFLDAYPLVVAGERGVEAWMGVATPRRRIEASAAVEPDRPVLLDAAGVPIVALWPLVQLAAPAPGASEALFFFEGRGRRGARLIAWPDGFEREDESLWDSLGELVRDAEPVTGGASLEEVSPFQGLAAYGAADASRFFGRERETEAFVNRLRISPLLAIVGPSGAGKSSFVHAGVVPALPAGWRVITVRPGAAPIASLASSLTAVGIDAIELASELAEQPGALGTVLRAHAQARGLTLVLVIDQFEEIFTLGADGGERAAYAAALARAARTTDDPVRVVLTLRDDFLLQAQGLEALSSRLSPGLQLLTTPSAADLERILVKPLARVGYEIDDPLLAREMVAEVVDRPGALALLSFTASKLWELRDRRFRQLGRKAYDSLGGVGGALAQHAEATLAAMPSEEQRLVREVFRHAVTAAGTRAVLSRHALEEILGGGSHANAVLEKLIRGRLLVTSEAEAGGERIEIVHEALLTAWPRLVGWRREDVEGARMRDQLRTASHQWDERGRPRGLLWRDDALAEYRIWRGRHPGRLPAIEEAFAAASVSDAARGRRIRTIGLSSAIAVLASVGLALLFLNARAERLRVEAEAGKHRLRDLLVGQYENQGRLLVLGDQPLEGLAYLAKAAELGAHGAAHDFLIARALQATEGERFQLPHGSTVLRVRFSPDGTRILTSSYDNTAKLWDATTGAPIATLAHDGPVFRAEFSHDGALIATASADGVAGVWNARSRRRLHALAAHRGGLATALFSPVDDTLVTVGLDDSVSLWDGRRGALRYRLRGPVASTDAAKYAAFSPDGRLLAVGDENGVTRIWRTADGTLAATLSGHAARVSWVEFSRDGRRLVTASHDGSTIVWAAGSGRRLAVLAGLRPVASASFSPDGRRLAIATDDPDGLIYDADSGALISRLVGHALGLKRAVFSLDGATLVTAAEDGTAIIWDAASGRRLGGRRGHEGSLVDLALSPDGTAFATAGSDNRAIVWTTSSSDQPVRLVGHQGTIGEARFSSDGRRVASASADGTARTWDVATGQALLTLDCHQGALSRIRFTPDGALIATGGSDGTIHLWDAHTGAGRGVLSGHVGAITSLDFDRTGARLLSSDRAGETRTWSVASGASLLTVRGHGEHGVLEARFLPDGARFLTLGDDGSRRLWRASDGSSLATFRAAETYNTVAFDRDGRRAVSCTSGKSPILWQPDTGTVVGSLVGHRSDLAMAEWSPDDALIATAGLEGMAGIWDASRGDLLARLDHGGSQVWSVDFSPDGRTLVTGTGKVSGDLWLWPLPHLEGSPDQLRRVLRCRVPFMIAGDRLQARPRDFEACGPPP